MLNIDLMRAMNKSFWKNGLDVQNLLAKNKLSFVPGINDTFTGEQLKPHPKYGYPVIKNSALCAASGIIFAGCIKLDSGSFVIIYDDLFEKLTDSSKEFVIYHEIGHIVHEDHKKIDATYIVKRMLCFSDIMNLELAADKYAIDKVGRNTVFCGLIEMLHIAGFNVTCNKEYKKRLEQCF